MPLTNLCSRLVVTSTRGDTPLPSFGLSLLRPPRSLLRLRLGGSPDPHASRSLTTLESHCWLLQPWVATQLVLHGQLESDHHSLGHARCPAQEPAQALWTHNRPDDPTRDASCRVLRPRPASQARPQEPGPARTAPHQRMRPHGSEAPSTNRSHGRRPGLRQSDVPLGRHWYPGLATEGPASDMRSRPFPRSARSTSFRLFAGHPWTTCRLSVSAMDCPPSTPSSFPIPATSRGKPRLQR